MTRIVFRPEAEADLLQIALHIAEHSPERARALVQRLRDRAMILKTTPQAGRLRPELGDGVRSLVERPYVLLYHLTTDGAELIAILHGARDLPAAMGKRMAEDRD